MDEYTQIPNWPKYRINKSGDIIGQRGKKLRPATNRDGYKTVVLCDNKFRKTMKVHRLVAITFIPNPLGKETVNHKNGNKLDNNISNLEWATQKEQQNHRVHRLGFGVDNAISALKKPVICIETSKTYDSIKEAANSLHGDRSRLSSAIKNNKPWHGLHWAFNLDKEVICL